jgi:DNA-binding CsgD family transcriptional regulator
MAKGMGSKQVGDQLNISAHTVDTYRRKLLKKLKCKNAVELTVFCIRNGLI